LGIDFTARDLQTKAKEKGLPWTLAKGFDGAAVISRFVPKDKFDDLNNIDFGLEIDGKTVQKGNTGLMLFSFDYIISYISGYMTLKKGDLIYTGTPKGVGPIAIGNRIKGYLENECMIDFVVK
jgi:2-keto-4-pentenoate hydratase/2-oxohepta-3-ene-1,7-dioic acid hydratase in catechol pathway